MTVAPDTRPLVLASVAEALDTLRARGMRVSSTRRVVLDALFAAARPLSAPQLAREFSLDETSVYRNLEVLERNGLVRHVHLGHGPGLYALFGRHEVEYLFCDRCSKVTPISPDGLEPLRTHLRASYGYEVRFTHFALVGLCADCARLEHADSQTHADRARRVTGEL